MVGNLTSQNNVTNGISGLSVPVIFMDKYDIYNTTINYSPPDANTISSFNRNSFIDSPWLTTQHY